MIQNKKVVNGALLYVTIEKGEWVRRGLRGWLRRLFGGRAVNSSGDWRGFLGDFHHEKQARNGFDSMSCTTFATLNAIELLMVAKGITGRVGRSAVSHATASSDGEAPQWSDRFTSLLAGTTQKGNTPQKVAESVRKVGLVPESELPWGDEVVDFESWNAGVTEELLALAKTAVRGFKFSHEWLWEERPAVERQLVNLREGLKYSPVGVAVYGWARGEDGKYIRNGQFANHWTLLIAIEENGDYVVLDSYEPFVKVLRKGYEFEFAKGYLFRKK